jgi:hypothetical protein
MEIVSGAEALGDGSSDAEELPIQAALQLVGVGGGSADGSAAASSVASSSTATATLEAGPHGEGSHAPLPDNSAPAGFTIKGNADSMLYHRPDSRSYSVTIAEVWFDTPERAEAAGFSLANTHPSS